MRKYLFAFLVFAAAALSAEDKIIASWDFSQKDSLNSGTAKLVLRGKSAIENGMLIASNSDKTKPSGAIVKAKNFKELTPQGAFSLSITFMLRSAWVRPARQNAYLYDTKYVVNKDKFHTGFMFYLATADGKSFTPCAAFGFGEKSASARGKTCQLKPDELHTAELLFSGMGKVSFFIDGKACGTGSVPAGILKPSKYAPVIGDRIGSDYGPLGGGIRKVVLKELPLEPLAVFRDQKSRMVFERGEKAQSFHFLLSNLSQNPVENITVKASISNQQPFFVKAGTVAAAKQFAFQIPVDTLLIPGTYTLNLEILDGNGKRIGKAESEFTIVPAYGDFMPVLMWGCGDPKTLAGIGFTHQNSGVIPHSGDFQEKDIPSLLRNMDENLKNGLYIYSSLVLNYRFLKPGRFLRKDRNGKNYLRPNVEASNPAVRQEVAKVVEDTAKAVGDHPAWDSVLSNSEVRDGSNPSFTGVEEAAFKKYAGYNIPVDIMSKYPGSYESYPELPWDRMIPDNDPHLTYFSWFWRTGDGWNDLHTLVNNTLHKNIRHHFWTFYDPVVRVPPQWGSGGAVDAVSQWTYTNPDPIKIGQATDEVIAMAQGRKGQKVMSMTQIIWYRNQTAPIEKKPANVPAWMKRDPAAKFITIPPDCIREAFWSKISRRLDGIQYHGIGSLLPGMVHGSYRFTNSETKEALREVLHRVIKPLGPALKSIPEREPEVAILEGFASSLFARQHTTLGWSRGWIGDLHLALQWAHFQPVILYEEHLLNNMQGKNLKVLFLPGLEVVTEKVATKLRELQKQGVILVGDEFTTPAVSPDFRLASVQRKELDPAESKAAFQKLGNEIAAMLKPYYHSPFDASSQEIIVRRRGSDYADYVFLVNDKRTFGDYLGQWGLVMEKGLPVTGCVTVNHPSGAAYDVVNHKSIPFRNEKDKTVFDIALAPGDGAIVLLTEKPIGGIELTLPSAPVAKGEAFEIACRIKDSDGKTVKSVMPLEIVLTSSDGVRLPGSGYYAAHDGLFTLQEIAATNMKTGMVKVLVKDLASGKSKTGNFIIK